MMLIDNAISAKLNPVTKFFTQHPKRQHGLPMKQAQGHNIINILARLPFNEQIL